LILLWPFGFQSASFKRFEPGGAARLLFCAAFLETFKVKPCAQFSYPALFALCRIHRSRRPLPSINCSFAHNCEFRISLAFVHVRLLPREVFQCYSATKYTNSQVLNVRNIDAYTTESDSLLGPLTRPPLVEQVVEHVRRSKQNSLQYHKLRYLHH
jgi:hypothetical protein